MLGDERRARAPGSTQHHQHPQDDDCDGVKYCPDMGYIVLPSYVPVNYKAGYSGGIGRAEQIQMVRQQYQVCHSCKDGPRCTDIYLYKQVLEVEDGSPGASTARTAHPPNQPDISAECTTVQEGQAWFSSP